MKKTYTELRMRKDFDKIPIKEIKESIGWTEPFKKQWDVNLLFEGEGMTVKDQAIAHILANTEQIKAMLIKLLNKKCPKAQEKTQK